jgi:hypothetical protein
LQNCSVTFTGATIGVYILRGTKRFCPACSNLQRDPSRVTKHGYCASSLHFNAFLAHACDAAAGDAVTGNVSPLFDREYRRTLARMVPTAVPTNIDCRDRSDE